jgi:hypothetical protein
VAVVRYKGSWVGVIVGAVVGAGVSVDTGAGVGVGGTNVAVGAVFALQLTNKRTNKKYWILYGDENFCMMWEPPSVENQVEFYSISTTPSCHFQFLNTAIIHLHS